jgi:hypothetical protein
MSFWNDPISSFQGLFDDPWRSMQNFGTTGLVPLIPAVAGVVGGVYGGPAGAVAAGSAAQGGVDYFGGNSDARTGKGIGKSLAIGGGKGYLGYLGADYGADYFGGGAGDAGGSFGGDWFSQLGSEGSSNAGGGGILESLGGSGGSFGGQEAFQLPASSYTPEYLNSLAEYQGVDAGNASYLDRLMGNTEQGLYNQESLAQKMSGQTASDMLKKRAQQSAISQLSKGGSAMQQQGQQSPQTQVPQAMMSRGQGVDTISALLSLLQEKEILRQPRISLI